MAYLFAVAVLGGAASVLTPCVFPLLPAILVVSRDARRRRVLGIAAGIELSFLVLVLLLAGAISALGLPANTLRWTSALLLAVFGIVLAVPSLSARFAMGAERLTAHVPQRSVAGPGFWPGFLTGLPLGLVWSPCAGPILAGITVAASRSRFSGETLVTMAGYGLGMAGPLAGLVFGGRRLAAPLRRVVGGGRRVGAVMGVVLLATSALIASDGLNRVNRFIAENIGLSSTPTAALERRALTRAVPGTADGVELSRAELEANGYPALGRLADLGRSPDFAGISRWFNTDGEELSMRSLRGKVVLVDFWTYSCINCIRTFPHLRTWHDRYADDGLVIVGVHTPEFEFEKDPGNVGRAVGDFDIEYPVALDPDYRTWDRFYNRFWPAHYLIDKTGRMRSAHYGEGAYVRTENEIRELLGMPGDATGREHDIIRASTPETYLGYQRAARFVGTVAGEPGLVRGEAFYSPPEEDGEVALRPDTWSYDGRWSVWPQHAVAGAGAAVHIRFQSEKVFIVAGPPEDGSGTIEASGTSGSQTVTVDRHQLYTVRSGSFANALLRLDVSPGVEVYAFTFG